MSDLSILCCLRIYLALQFISGTLLGVVCSEQVVLQELVIREESFTRPTLAPADRYLSLVMPGSILLCSALYSETTMHFK